MISELIESYDFFLIDAYGVLVTSSGSLPGAESFIEALRTRGRPFRIVTNDASRTPENCSGFYAKKGLRITPEEIITAGLTIKPAFERLGLKNPKCAALGTADTAELVRRAGGNVVEISADAKYDAVVIGDDAGFDFLPTMNALLTSLHRSVIEGRVPSLLLANPDLLYPVSPGAYGFTSGSVARLLELGLEQLHPGSGFRFEVLGKPARLIFDTALASMKADPSRTVMLGDQLHTDIAGAKAAGIDSVLVTTGIARSALDPATAPDHVIASLLP